ncbi:creatininase family protein [Planctomyces sp. SH-PL14]|uniref:creatininase family protein n=1 Tax=Planctomyces sp. SH-PL14 TaxID=1632864 RepID=UPI00078E16FC|nr:creatininase family protein [Planctomyces sp. SH-PL14]AMV18503.1 Creatinine amidohydrolase [Planctomyces sp. SH-PL14]
MNLAEMTWKAVANLDRDTPVVIPVAALEQHGHHLPVFTDSMLLGEVVRRVEPELAEQVLFAPLQWLGNSDHHLDFPGTMTAAPRTYIDLLGRMAENFLHHGFRRIVFLNGHGGNEVPGRQAIFELRQAHRKRADLLLLFSTYWDFGDPTRGAIPLVQRQMGHACEWETSMILRIAPDLVGPIEDLDDVSFEFGFGKAYRGWVTQDRTETGHIGAPRSATPEKGEQLFQTYAVGVTRFLREVAEWDGQGWKT